jgi:hypothetical protein
MKLGTDLGSRLHRFGVVNGKRRVVTLEKHIKRWLQKQFAKNVTAKFKEKNSKNIDWLIWPFDFALTMLDRPDKGRTITLAEITSLIQNLITGSGKRSPA